MLFAIHVALIFGTFVVLTEQGSINSLLVKKVREMFNFGGSLECSKALHYNEFVMLQQFLAYPQLKPFGEAYSSLKYKVDKIVIDHPALNTNSDSEELGNLIRNVEKSPVIYHEMIIACKIFLAEVFSDGGEASWLNINSFIESDKYVQLHAIFQLGLIQSEYLDKAMLENMYNQHLRNKAESLQSAIIVGAGPNGLYSAFKLFLLGMNVTLVNDREEYIRNQLVNLDGNWMIHLSIWLGTKFDELFLEEESPGFVNETFADGGLINIKLLEIAMKTRLEALASYSSQQSEGSIKLDLLFGVTVERIQFPTESNTGFKAVLNHSNHTTLVSFNILVCAAGVKDNLRNTYVGIPKEYTVPENYGVAVLIKEEAYSHTNFLGDVDERPLDELNSFLIDQNLDDYVKSSTFLPEELRTKYSDITHQMCKHSINPRLLESRFSLCISAVTDPVLARLLKIVENEKIKLTKDHKDVIKYNDFKFHMQRKWFAAIANQYINYNRHLYKNIIDTDQQEKPGMLNFDQHAINSSTFDLTQFALDKAAVEYSLLGNSAIVVAVGDSAATPHYYSGSGMSTGRIGIERALNLAKQYKDGNITETHVLIDKLNENFEKIKAQVLALGKDYVKSRSQKERDRIAMETMCFAVNKMIRNKKTRAEHGFEIKSHQKVSPEAPNFELYIFHRAVFGNVYFGKITENGQIQIGGMRILLMAL